MAAALSSAACIAPAARRVACKKSTASKKSAAFRCNAIYTESARVPSSDDDRRWNETRRVLARTQEIHTMQELNAAFQLAGDKLVMVAIESDEECTMSDQWLESTTGTETNQEQCRQLSSSLARIAREADDVTFLKVEIVGDNSAREVAHQLGATKYPTFQYYKVRRAVMITQRASFRIPPPPYEASIAPPPPPPGMLLPRRQSTSTLGFHF